MTVIIVAIESTRIVALGGGRLIVALVSGRVIVVVVVVVVGLIEVVAEVY